MPMVEILRRSGGLEAIARELGLAPSEVLAAANGLLPGLLEAIRESAQCRAGDEALAAFLESHGGYALATSVMAPEPTDMRPGKAMLAELFGSPARVESFIQSSHDQSGLDQALLAAVLPRLAMLVAGYVSARAASAAVSGPTKLAELLVSRNMLERPRSGGDDDEEDED